MKIPTPHIGATSKSQIARTVLMPGDPERARYIAEKYLQKLKVFNKTRAMYGATGFYEGKYISVMGSGMGMPSIGIYSYELFNFYDVENIIRVGSCGAYDEKLLVGDIVVPKFAWTDSNFGENAYGFKPKIISAQGPLRNKMWDIMEASGINIVPASIVHSSDAFYHLNPNYWKIVRKNTGASVVEMESFALFLNAKQAGKNAATILTVSDMLWDFSNSMTAEQRETSLDIMIKIALWAGIQF